MTGALVTLALSAGMLGSTTDSDRSVSDSSASDSPVSDSYVSDYGTALRVARVVRKPLLVVLETPSERFVQLDAKQPEDPGSQQEQEAAEPKAEGLLDPYYVCRVDVTTPYGKEVAEAFQAREFPQLAIIDKRAEVVLFRHIGPISDKHWRIAVEKHRSGTRQTAGTVVQTASPVGFQGTPAGPQGSTIVLQGASSPVYPVGSPGVPVGLAAGGTSIASSYPTGGYVDGSVYPVSGTPLGGQVIGGGSVPISAPANCFT